VTLTGHPNPTVLLERHQGEDREQAMAAERYHADSENGDHVADPSGRTLTRLIASLDLADNTIVVLTPDSDDPAWFTSVLLLDRVATTGPFRPQRHEVLRPVGTIPRSPSRCRLVGPRHGYDDTDHGGKWFAMATTFVGGRPRLRA
jgi:hypothetical protein